MSDQAEESKGILSTIQEKAVSLFHKITGEAEEAKNISSRRERRGGRRRPRSENSENERGERRRRRRRRIKDDNDGETISLVRQRRGRRNPDRPEPGSSRSQNTTELAMVHYQPRVRREIGNDESEWKSIS